LVRRRGDAYFRILNIDYKSEKLKKALAILKEAKYERTVEMLEKIKKSGIELKDDSF
jgi:predicted O-methyltransferase YrrM